MTYKNVRIKTIQAGYIKKFDFSVEGSVIEWKEKKLPVGIEFFDELIRQDFYYVDKTELIAELLHNWGAVNLFTRPRRFGKSLNMNMLKYFFEVGFEQTIFDGLKISKETELCEKYMGQFPVISIMLKGVEGINFEAAKKALGNVIGTEAKRFSFLKNSERLDEDERAMSFIFVARYKQLRGDLKLPFCRSNHNNTNIS